MPRCAYTSAMPLRGRLRSGRLLVCFVVAYAVVLTVSPALHHDTSCLLKSPTHCPWCLAHHTASPAESTEDLATVSLPSAGEIELVRVSRPEALGLVHLTGRAPPA
jgi:hypothetical protein